MISKNQNSLAELKKTINALADPKQAATLQRFFKTGSGEYGEGDIFLGIKVPAQRDVAKNFFVLPLADCETLLHSKIHEQRLTALIILVGKFKKGDEKTRADVFRLYLKNTEWVNNWDLVDLSAPQIVGGYLLDKPRKILSKLAVSKNLWERRIAIVSTLAFIRADDFAETLRLAEMLLRDQQDLIQKAAGWMLREVGKKSGAGECELIAFLDQYAKIMPRTMLRYAIERLSEDERGYYLRLKSLAVV